MDGPSVQELSTKVLRDGFLIKRGLRSGRWQKRWFVLTNDNDLYYFRTETSEIPKGCIRLKRYTTVTTSTKKSYSLVLYTDNNTAIRVYHLAAETYQDLDTWIKEISTAIKRSNGEIYDLAEEKSKYASSSLARQVAFTVVEAKNIASGKDPYVVAQVASRYIQTRTIHKSTNPFWGDSYVLDVDEDVKEKRLDFKVTVMDEDWLSKDKVIGHVNIPLDSLQPGKLNEQWYPLSSIERNDVVAGMLHIVVEASNNSRALLVRVMEGKELASRNADGTSDPFVEVRVGDAVQKTPIIKKTLNPFWNKKFMFNVNNKIPDSIDIVCWDWDMLGGNNYLGEVSIALSGVDLKEKIDMWYMLTSAQPRKRFERTASDNSDIIARHNELNRSPKLERKNDGSNGPPPLETRTERSSSAGSLLELRATSAHPANTSLSTGATPDPGPSPSTSPPTTGCSPLARSASSSLKISKSASKLNLPKIKGGSFKRTQSEAITEAVSTTPSASKSAPTSPSNAAPVPAAVEKPKSNLGEVRLKIRYMVSVILPFGSYDKLLELLLEDKCALATTLNSVIAPDERENLAINLVKIFTCRYSILSLLKALTAQEINDTLDPEIIFRSNSLASKAVEYYMRVAGSTYLHKTIGPVIKQIIASKRSYEVDPMKAEPNEDVESNQKRLVTLAESAVLAIFHSEQACPTNFREVYAHLQDTVLRKWGFTTNEKVKYSAVSGFLFLRFFCPAILGPKLFGLMDGLPDPKTSRTLTLLSKIVQNLANLVEFGQKEPYMSGINQFVTDHFANMRSFFDRIATPPRGNWPGFIEADQPQINLQREVSFFHSFLNSHKAALLQHEALDQTIKTKLATILTELDIVAVTELKARRNNNITKM